MEKQSYFHLVGTGPKSGKDDEYSAWYDEHVKESFLTGNHTEEADYLNALRKNPFAIISARL